MPKGKKKQVVPCCSVCGKAMPEAEVWRGRIVVCEKKSCRKDVRAFGKSNATPRYIGANEVRCGRPGCDKYVPEGYFQPNLQYTVCSESCYWRRSWEAEILTCAYPPCGKEFRGRSGYRRYCSKEHAKLHVQDQHLDSFCGGFRDLYQEYIDSASLSKRSMSTQRSGLALFFHFVNEHEITDIETVVPATITRFLKWGEETAKPSVWNAIWVISSFMDWMRGTGRRKGANPVITRYHRRPKAKRLPRPYTEEQMRYIWMLLEQRGTTVVRLAVAIAEETGIRISELANIRMADIDRRSSGFSSGCPTRRWLKPGSRFTTAPSSSSRSGSLNAIPSFRTTSFCAVVKASHTKKEGCTTRLRGSFARLIGGTSTTMRASTHGAPTGFATSWLHGLWLAAQMPQP